MTPLIVSKESKSRSTVLWKDPHSPSWVADVFRLWKETARPYPTSDYTVFKNGSRSIVARWKSSDGPVIIKHYKTPGLRRRVRFAFSKSRCMQNWHMSELCHSLGLAVPKFIFVAEERWVGLPGRSLSIMEYIKGIPLHLWATNESRTATEIREVAVNLAKEIDRLSNAMITHGDCKASNIIVTGDHQPYFVDLDGAIQHRSRSAFRKAYFRDARRFRANWLQDDTGELFSNVFSDHPLHS